MPTAPRSVVEAAAKGLLRSLAGLKDPLSLRVVEAEGRVACLILVWDKAAQMPTLGGERRKRNGKRGECKQDILAAVRTAGRPLTRKEIVKALRDAKCGHGPGTIAKALADLTSAGQLLNPRDKRGYRLPEWPRPPETPSLFS